MSEFEVFGDAIRMKTPTTEPIDEQRSEEEHEAEEDSELQQEQEQSQDQEEDEDEEFSFVCLDPDTSSPISADDLFYDGQIKPLYPLFNQALIFGDEEDNNHSISSGPQLRKIFIEHPSSSSSSKEDEENNTASGNFCEWSGKSPIASPDRCKKSNSTGFSKLWRFRDLLHRSSSDGRDTFVFLHSPSAHKKNQQVVMESGEASSSTKGDTVEKHTDEGTSVVKVKTKTKGAKTEKPISAHERHYMRNRVLKEEEKRRSYLPYKVGFFTSSSGLSRNVHPF